MKQVGMIAFFLTVFGGINWGLVGAFDFNLVDTVFGAGGGFGKIVYILIGVSAVFCLFKCKGHCKAA